MRITLDKPANWEDFENLCFHLWKSIWGDHASHPNGRRGQRQNGVDIYGRPPFHEPYTGIQCKGKNDNYGQKLTREEIDTECENAKDFKPQLDTFIMATTSPRDVDVQEHCREINAQKNYNFEVDTWSWDDIEEEVQCRPEIMEIFYPKIKELERVNEIKVSRIIASSNRLHAFFSRPGLLDFLNRFGLNLVDNLSYELAINAFEHGKATYFNISIEGNRIIYKDNGLEFNPITLLESEEKRGGGMTLKYAKEVFALDYRFDGENVFELTYKSNLANKTEDTYSINLSVQDVFGRIQMRELAIQEISKIPGDVSNIVIDIFGMVNPAISTVYSFFSLLQKSIKTKQSVRVYLPNGLYYYSDLVEKFKDDPRIEFKLKN